MKIKAWRRCKKHLLGRHKGETYPERKRRNKKKLQVGRKRIKAYTLRTSSSRIN
nr:MAG TPA: hypothetical protein [Caudoviricetes sp.]